MKVRSGSALSVTNTVSYMDKYLQFFLNLFSQMGAIPYKVVQIPETKDRVIFPNKNFSYYIWIFAFVSGSANFLKTAVSLSWMANEYLNNGEVIKVAFHCFWVVAHLIITGVHLVCIVHYQELVNLINGTVGLCRKLETVLEPNLYTRPRLIRTTLMSIFCMNMVSSTVVCTIPAFIFFKDDVWHYGSNIYHFVKLLNFPYSKYLAIGLGLMMDNWYICTSWGAAVLHIYALLLIIQTFMTSLRFIERCTKQELKKRKGLLKLHSAVYPKLRMIVLLLNNSYGICYYPLVTSTVGIMTIQGICMAVGLAHLNSIVLTAFGIGAVVCCGTGLVIIMSFTGIVQQESVKYFEYLRRNKVYDKMSLKVLKSIRIESIQCGSFYAIKKYTSLTLLGMITNISGSLLISLKVKA